MRGIPEKMDDRVQLIQRIVDCSGSLFHNLNPSRDQAWQAVDLTMPQLKALTKLQKLNLHGGKVTDAGLEQLQGLEGLQTLDLGATKITDAGMPRLKTLAKLQSLGLTGTALTTNGTERRFLERQRQALQ